jgi:hypothetical protein
MTFPGYSNLKPSNTSGVTCLKVDELVVQPVNANSCKNDTKKLTSLCWWYIVNHRSGVGSSAVVLKKLILSCANIFGSSVDMYLRASIIAYMRLFINNNAVERNYGKDAYEVMKSVFSMVVDSSHVLDASSDILLVVEKLLVSFLVSDPRSLVLSDTDANLIVEQALVLHQVMENTKNESHCPRHCLLTEIIQSDKGRFSAALLDLVTNEKLGKYILDNVGLHQALFHTITYDGIHESHLNRMTYLFDHILHRLKSLAAGNVKDSRYLESLTCVMIALCSVEQLRPSLQSNDFTRVATELVEDNSLTRVRSISKKFEHNILVLALRCSQWRLPGKSTDNRLNAVLIHRFSHHASQTLKVALKTSQSSKEMDAGLSTVLILLIQSLDPSLSTDHSYLASLESSWIGNIIRPCLKYGIGNVVWFTHNVQRLCIKIVRQILDVISTSGLDYGVSESVNQCIVAKQIFEMTTTHSNINNIMSAFDGGLLSIKHDIICLLLSCTRLWDSSNCFNEKIWRMLLSTYNAGMSESDEMLREVILTYGKLANEVCSVDSHMLHWNSYMLSFYLFSCANNCCIFNLF